MEPKNTVEAHVRAAERMTMNTLAPLSEMMNQSRTLFEKSVAVMRGETMEMLNRLHARNGEMLSAVNGGNIAAWTTAQEKWFRDCSRDFYQASMRFHETTRHLLADGMEGVGQSLRNGAIAAEDTADAAAAVAEKDATTVREFSRETPMATHRPEYNA
jgi:hypothetical protein